MSQLQSRSLHVKTMLKHGLTWSGVCVARRWTGGRRYNREMPAA